METEGRLRVKDVFVGIRDPRQAKMVEHDLVELLVIAVCGVLAGADDFVEIEAWANEKSVLVDENATKVTPRGGFRRPATESGRSLLGPPGRDERENRMSPGGRATGRRTRRTVRNPDTKTPNRERLGAEYWWRG